MKIKANRAFCGLSLAVATLLAVLRTKAALPPPPCGLSSRTALRSDNAWVFLASDSRTYLHVLVSAKSARIHGTDADIVVLWLNSTLPPPCMRAAAAEIGIELRPIEAPLGPDDVKNKHFASIISRLNKWWDFAKLCAFQMTEYRRVIFLDGDTLFMHNMDELFSMPGAHTDAPKSPFNSGLFVLEPSHEDYQQLIDTVKRGDYDLERGWGGAFEDKESLYRPRTYAPFYGAETTQGLLWYFFHVVKKTYTVLPQDKYHHQLPIELRKGNKGSSDRGEEEVMEPWLVHFNICPKPVPGVIPEQCKRYHRRWQKVYAAVEVQCGDSDGERESAENK